MNSTFFYCLESEIAALPLNITISYFKTELDEIVLSDDIAEVGNYLDHIDDKKLITYIQKSIAVSDINAYGPKNASRRVIQILIPKLTLITGITPKTIYRTVGSPPSYYNKTTILSENDSLYRYCAATKWINFFQRKWYATNIASFKYPEYNWHIDYAKASDEQMILCLENGLCYEYHHLDFIMSFGDRLYNLQTIKSFKGLYNNIYYERPSWWNSYTGLTRLYESLSDERLEHMQRLYMGSSENSKVIARSKFIETNKPINYARI